MNTFDQIESWGNSHRIAITDYIRVVIGLFITYKGVSFMLNIDSLQALTGGLDVLFASIGIAHYVIYAHVIGGPLIALGLYTRIASMVQIPILIGAVAFVNYQEGFLSVGSHMELEVSIVVLLLLIVFVIFGAGKFSIDEIRRNDRMKA